MSRFIVAPIVEGHGEVQAVPALLRRLVSERYPAISLEVNPPIRVTATRFLAEGAEFDRTIKLAAAKVAQARSSGMVLILLDCEDRCPAQLGPTLLQRAREVRSDVPILVSLAYREYETWFLAAAESLRGQRGLPLDLEPPSDPERIRDAKGWLKSRGGAYREVVDQPALTQLFDLELAARRSGSLRRLLRRLEQTLVGLPRPE